MKQIRYSVRQRIRRGSHEYSFNHYIYVALLLPLLLVTGLTLNRLSTDMLLTSIEHKGINYDAFRELELSIENYDRAEERISELLKQYPVLKKATGVDPIGYLTFCMLARTFELDEKSMVNTAVFVKCLPRISQLQGYQRLYGYYKAILKDIQYFPVPIIEGDTEDITYSDTWSQLRKYGGKRKHEGTDIMARNNIRGYYPVISITDGVIEKKGWLEQGGYRIGVRSPSGGYFYYAHLASYAQGIEEGDTVIAGQLLGFMGDSGYGEEGTVGQFDVHLHLGIYVQTEAGELSVNPYNVLKLLERSRPVYPRLYD
jgi:peptidoglycan LD-endopeptidase LytH